MGMETGDIIMMTTYSGHRLDPLRIAPDDIRIIDIAHSLSLMCRFGGHCKEFYSVAQHCVRVSNAVPPEFALEGLLHDATEAYAQDLIRPVKRRLPEYQKFEDRIWWAIATKFGFDPNDVSAPVKLADNQCLKSEIHQLMANFGAELSVPFWSTIEELPPVSCFYEPWDAESLYIRKFNELMGLTDG